MAKYSTFKYGDGTTYGTQPWDANLKWTFIVDWTGTGHTGENEAERMVDLRVRRGRSSLLGARGENFEQIKPGEAVAILDNSDQRYEPEYASSPLYPNVVPGKFVRIAVLDDANDTNYEVMRGVIMDIQPVLINGVRHVRIVVGDGLQWLLDHQVLTNRLVNTAKSTIATAILTAADWPAEWGSSVDDTALMAETYYYWWTWKSPGLTELREIAKTEVGIVFHSRDGDLCLYSRDYAHTRTQTVDVDEMLADFLFPYSWDNVRNEIQCNIYPKSLGNEDIPGVVNNKVWELGAATENYIDIADGATITVDCPFKDSVATGPIAVVNPRIIYLVYDNGAEIQGDCTLTYESPTGGGTRMHITNNSGGAGTLKSAAWYGDILQIAHIASRKTEDATSQSVYGKRVLTLTGQWRTGMFETQDVADWVLAELKDPVLEGVAIKIQGRPILQFYPDLYDKMVLTYGESRDFRVGQIEHQWLNSNGTDVITTFSLEPYLTPFT